MNFVRCYYFVETCFLDLNTTKVISFVHFTAPLQAVLCNENDEVDNDTIFVALLLLLLCPHACVFISPRRSAWLKPEKEIAFRNPTSVYGIYGSQNLFNNATRGKLLSITRKR